MGIKERSEVTRENDFNERIKILEGGRYELELPWKEVAKVLPNKKELAWRRHINMVNKLKKDGLFDDSMQVFRDWENMTIIERVPEGELNNPGHSLPHMHRLFSASRLLPMPSALFFYYSL